MDGVYDKDPKKHADAIRYTEVGYTEVLSKALGVMDASAVAMCRDNKMPIMVFDLKKSRQYNANGDGRSHRNDYSLIRGSRLKKL